MKYLIGADPELFVMDQGGAFVNGHGLIPGTKEKPFRVNRGAVQVDGMALEFNIDPASSRQEFIDNILVVKEELLGLVSGRGLVTVPVPVAMFPEDYYEAQPEESKILGCTPDYNAWTHMENPSPNGAFGMRTAAGHVHIGWTNGVNTRDIDHFLKGADIVRQLDHFVGLASVILDPDNTRRQMYGRAGAFRPKSYGVEYRVPSNFWLKSPEFVGWMYDAIEYTMDTFDAGQLMDNKNVPMIINTSSVEEARALLPANFPLPIAA